MSNKVYDILKYIALIGINAVVMFLNTLGDIWQIPYIGKITATLSAIGVLIGSLIGISSANYQKKLKAQLSEEKKGKK